MFKDKKNWLITGLVVVLLLVVGYLLMGKYNEGQQAKLNTAYRQGIDNANLAIVNQVLTDINNNGYTIVTFPTQDNKTASVPLYTERSLISTIIMQLNQKGKFSFNTLDQNNKTITVDLIMPQMCGQQTQQTTQ